MTDLKKLLISAAAVTAVNAASVLFMEYVIGSAYEEVAVSAVICLAWLLYAAVFCKKGSADGEG